MPDDNTAAAIEPRDKAKVLLVDDEPSLTKLFKMVINLDLPEVDVDTAANGVEAVESFGLNHQAVIVMDLHMPLMDGHMAFCEIQKMCDIRGWEMPSVVFCTGYASPEAIKKLSIENKQHCILSKPTTPSEVTDAVRERL